MRRIIYVILMVTVAVVAVEVRGEGKRYLFSAVNEPGCDMKVRSIMQLPDLRMAIATEEEVKIYDGAVFSRPAGRRKSAYELELYDGYHHLYVSDGGRYLWIKDMHRLWCVDLDRNRYVEDIDSIVKAEGVGMRVDDIFGDRAGRMWYVCGDTLLQPSLGLGIATDSDRGRLLDLATDRENVYLFYRSGDVVCHELSSGDRLYERAAYRKEEKGKYDYTSHVVEGKDGFYQIRNGSGSGFFRFDPKRRQWTRLLDAKFGLNTLAVTDTTALISTSDGLLIMDLRNGTTEYLTKLRTRSGNVLASGINTLCVDISGGIWLGLHNRGILYTHPAQYRHISIPKSHDKIEKSEAIPSSVFREGYDGSVYIDVGEEVTHITFGGDSTVISHEPKVTMSAAGEYGTGASFVAANGAIFFNDADCYNIYVPEDGSEEEQTVSPIISGLLVNGEDIRPGDKYDGNTILRRIPSRQGEITLGHNQNFVTICVSSPVYSDAVITYHYRLEGYDNGWQSTTAGARHDRRLRVTYPALTPGEYVFRVKLADSHESREARLKIHVLPPWWDTTAAWIAYVLLACVTVVAASRIYASRTKRRIEAEQREANLLMRIRQLIEEVDRYKAEGPSATAACEGDMSAAAEGDAEDATDDVDEKLSMSDADKAFVARAVEIVERNLDTPGYSVVQLSRDLCMDRTGLYRKLNSLLDRSPSIFIRDIRLSRAAALLSEGRMSVTEIAEKTGFSTTSYMSKCFQERYGCRPSEYAAKVAGTDIST